MTQRPARPAVEADGPGRLRAVSVSMFRRVVRFAERGSDNPAENRLTEITAAVLERHPVLARGFIAALLRQAARNARPAAQPRIAAAHAWLAEHGDTAEVLVSTQLMRGGRYVDLELRLAYDPLRRARDLVVWVEIKHGAGISGDQLDAYLSLIDQEPGVVRTIIVLAPGQTPPSGALVPDAVSVALWQQVLGDCLTRLPRQPQASASALLLQELIAYFEEEGLMPAQPLTTELALSLAVRDAANKTVTALCTIVHERVLESYADGGAKGRGNPQYGTGFWARHAITPSSPTWLGAWLEWGLRNDYARPERRGAYAFVAGASFNRSADVAGGARHEQWLAARLNQGFERVTHELPRLWSYRYPEQLLIASTFEEQADLLGDWVLERFDALTANPPSLDSSREVQSSPVEDAE